MTPHIELVGIREQYGRRVVLMRVEGDADQGDVVEAAKAAAHDDAPFGVYVERGRKVWAVHIYND